MAKIRSQVDSADEYTTPGTSSFNPSLDTGIGESYRGTSGSASGSSGNSSGGIGSALESVAGDIFGGALGLGPLVGSLFGLFDGKPTQQAAFSKYEMPSSISFEAADTANGLVNADYGQMGLPRLYDGADAGTVSSGVGGNVATAASSMQGSPGGSPVAATGGSAGMPQISVNVQAIDAQSFMSYSGEIAKAVRDAMLNLSSLNDVVTEL